MTTLKVESSETKPARITLPGARFHRVRKTVQLLCVVAFILLCIGIQIAWNGLSALIATILKP